MTKPVTYNPGLSRSEVFEFTLEFLDGSTRRPVDVSQWEFKYVMRNSAGTIVWEVNNGDFTRANNYTISFEKDLTAVSTITEDQYSVNLYATNDYWNEHVILTGYCTTEP